MTSLIGTWTLLRFILRRDRVRIPIWIVAFLITMIGTAAIFPDTYPTAADRQARATLIENPAMRLFVGPLFGSEDYTFGAMMASEMLGLTTVVIALMSTFMVVRHTRAEEESARAELISSSVVGRYASLTAALIGTAGLNLVIAITVALGLTATLAELDLAGSLTFGAAMLVTGLMFAGLAAVAVQINEFARGATGMTIAVLGVTYIARGFGDMLENALSWVPPFGLSLQTAPYVLDRWWPLLIGIGLTAFLVGLAFNLSTRRDVAAALRPPRPGPAHASRRLSTPLGLVVRLQRGSLIAWGVGIVLFGTLYGTMTTDIGEMYAQNPMVQDYFDVLGLSLDQITESVIAMFVMFFGMLLSIYAVGTVTRLRGEESSLRAENVLATAVSRLGWAGSAVAFGVVTSTIVLLLTGFGAGMTHANNTGNLSDIWTPVGAVSVYAPALWLAVGVAMMVFGWFPRAMALAWFVPAYGFFALMIGPLIGLPEWLYNLSPFEYVPRVPSADFEILPLAVMTAIATALIAIGLYGFRLRDLDLTS